MLGSSTPLPGITERLPYDRAWFAVDLPKYGTATFRRALAGGPFELFPDDVQSANGANAPRLSARHDASNTNNVFVLGVSESGDLSRLETINLALTPNQPVGSTPSGLGLSADGSKLAINMDFVGKHGIDQAAKIAEEFLAKEK